MILLKDNYLSYSPCLLYSKATTTVTTTTTTTAPTRIVPGYCPEGFKGAGSVRLRVRPFPEFSIKAVMKYYLHSIISDCSIAAVEKKIKGKIPTYSDSNLYISNLEWVHEYLNLFYPWEN